MPPRLQLRVHRADELDVARWEELTRDAELEFGLDFLRYANLAGKGDRMVLSAELGHELVGAMQVTRVTEHSFWLSRPAAVLAEALGSDAVSREYAAHLYPAVAVRNLCDANPLVVAPQAAVRKKIMRFLVAGLARTAAAWGSRSVTFLSVSRDDADLRALLESLAFIPADYSADAVIELGAARNLDGYLAALPARRRVNARNEISRFHRSGLIIEESGFDALPEVVRQESRIWAKYGNDVGFDALWQLREPLATHLRRHTRLVVCRDRRGTLLASAVHLVGRRTYHCFTYGARPEAPSGTYAMVTFYEPVRYATSHGLGLVMLGDTSLRAKTLRGARIRELTAYTLAYSASGTEYYNRVAAMLNRQPKPGSSS